MLCCHGQSSVLLSKEGGSILGKEVVVPKRGHARKLVDQSVDAMRRQVIILFCMAARRELFCTMLHRLMA